MKPAFWGGVHPPARKSLTQGASARIAPVPRYLIYPLSAHSSGTCAPAVAVGDSVLAGQEIGIGDKDSISVFSSVSGHVVAIEPRFHPDGSKPLSIVVENNFRHMRDPSIKKHTHTDDLEAYEIIDILRKLGIAGKGGAYFPIIEENTSQSVDYLLVNACECEPYVTADDSLMCYYPDQIILGIELISKLLRPNHTVIAIESNKQKAVDVLGSFIKNRAIDIRVLPTRYPQGAKEQLIQAVTGREIPPGGTPLDVGCAIYNVATCASVYKAVYDGEPIIKRIVTVTGGAAKQPENFVVLIGTPISHLIEAAGGFKAPPHKIIAGGPMMGFAQAVPDAPIVRTINAVLCLGEEDRVAQAHPVCLRCGKCLSACPMHLQPLYIYRYEAANRLRSLKKMHPEDCIECGCCSYVCPGKISLVDSIRRAKKRIIGEGGV